MDMIPKVRDWLEKQGYTLEMRAASAFRAASFDTVRQSSYYTDAETSKAREMDVIVVSRSTTGFLDIRFFVECKSGDKPWVLLCSSDTLVNYNRLFAFCAMSDASRKYFVAADRFSDLLEKFPWLKKDRVIAAYSLRQAFSEVDAAYTAAMNVTQACHAHVTRGTSLNHLHFAFPVIVVDAPIVHCTLDEKGGMELHEVEAGEFLFQGHQVGTCIRVITVSELSTFAKEAKEVAEQLIKELEEEEERLLASIDEFNNFPLENHPGLK